MSIAELEMRLEAAKAAWSTAYDTARAGVTDSAWSDERDAMAKLDAAEDALAAACLKGEGER